MGKGEGIFLNLDSKTQLRLKKGGSKLELSIRNLNQNEIVTEQKPDRGKMINAKQAPTPCPTKNAKKNY